MRRTSIMLAAISALALATGTVRAAEPAAASPDAPPQIVVTASTQDVLGTATTSSEGAITRQEIQRRPAYRVGQYLEAIPGLSVTSHSGEGKANQYLLRGFNLDHGTDFATFVDGMPVNQRTHAHGQGYTDLNFLMPELFGGIAFTKGPYFAAAGDFAAVGSARLSLVDSLPPTLSLSAGTVGDRRVFAGGSVALRGGTTLLGAGEYFHLDGPWDNPDNLRRFNGVVRLSHGTAEDGWSATAMAYSGRWNATTDQPLRAVEQGLIGRFGSLDPSDGGISQRMSLSLRYARPLSSADQLTTEIYGVRQHLTLWSNFTHYLDDPVNGDQHAQNDRRWIAGGSLALTHRFATVGIDQTLTLGIDGRFDAIRVDLAHTRRRAVLSTDRDDQVEEASLGVYVEHKAQWLSWLRTVLGLRVDRFHVADHDLVRAERGHEHAALWQPKGSVILGPWARTEFYVSAGRGFHSNDGRAGLVTADDGSTTLVRPPLLVGATSMEAGLRSNLMRQLTLAATVFQIDFASELTYSADAGQTEAGRPSRRRGLELSAQYRPLPWLELNSNLAFSHARYRDGAPATRFIEDAPGFIGAAGVLVDNLGPWSGALTWRRLGPHPLTEDNSQRSPGYGEINLSAGYQLTPRVNLRADIYNLLGSRDDAADYYYVSRLPGEPAAGVAGINAHPLEPRSLRVTLSATL
ncbi:TonB-dependent receptor [Novosphingobium sp. B-7]|uniref:TonB-dependent receptor n=1 Tax=Novosphingobium sp. B-7 TaxID=1298855 RepID=UPI0003B7892E|nr:TonB-dependent receptor [Novosphingobium sp. B-7]